jgi:hypothetical protein
VLRFPSVSSWSTLLIVACSSPAPAELSLSLVSDGGLIDADVNVVSPVERGNNELFVELHPHQGGGQASLVGVRATMAAHGHEARAETLERTARGFHASDLELFMSGRWQVELELMLDDQPDALSLPVDVP